MAHKPKQFIDSVFKPLFILALAIFSFYSSSSFAFSFSDVGSITADQMLNNIAQSVPSLMRLTTAIGYVLGMFFVIKGIMGLKEYGETRTHGGQHGGLKGPLALLAVGALLLYLPSSVHVGLSTFWDNPTPYAYVTKDTDAWTSLTNSVFLIAQLIGTIAFIRGLIIMSHMGDSGHQQGSFGRAMAHIVGGIFLINLYQFIQTIMNTLFLGQ